MFIENLLWFVVVIFILTFVHELGHFYIARIFKVSVSDFSIGFGPTLFHFTDKKKTKWRLSLVPFGGYIRIKGDELELDKDEEEKIANLSQQEQAEILFLRPTWQKILVVAAGPAFNYLFAILCAFFIFSTYGASEPSLKIQKVHPNSIAQELGLQKNDLVQEINGQVLAQVSEFQALLANQNELVSLSVVRDNQIQKVSFRFHDQSHKVLGVTFAAERKQQSFSSSIYLALKYTYLSSKEILEGIKKIIVAERSYEDIGGPIKIAQLSAVAAESGLQTFVYLLFIMSINIALVNLLPLPVLDGGRLLFYVIEVCLGAKINKRLKIACFNVSIVSLIFLIALALFNDITAYFN